MPRPLQRATLESGFKLDINSLARRGFIRPGAATGLVGIGWTHHYFGRVPLLTDSGPFLLAVGGATLG